jgi:hypothetical protein
VYTRKNLELQTHLICHDHPGKWCYKPVVAGGICRASDHVEIGPPALRDWTTAIINDSATINCPPHSIEFNALLYGQGQRGSKSSAILTPPVAQTPLPIIIQLDRSQSRGIADSHSTYHSNTMWSPSAPQTPRRRQPVQPTLASSPLVNHRAFDECDGDGLLAFIKWLERKYKVKDGNTAFQQAYQVLSSGDKDITVDVLSGKTAQWIESHGVTPGTADRMAKCYPKLVSEISTML